jgi:hypothetical protein
MENSIRQDWVPPESRKETAVTGVKHAVCHCGSLKITSSYAALFCRGWLRGGLLGSCCSFRQGPTRDWRRHPGIRRNRPGAKRFRVKLTNLKIPKVNLVEAFIDLLEGENFKSKNLADEYPVFMPAYVGR